MSGRFLLYGSTGFVGREVLRLALARGLDVVAAGRDRERVEAQAREHGVASRVFSLADHGAVRRALGDVPLVVNCAGPFLHTFAPMVAGCLTTGTHYLDITGEIPVLEGLASLDAEARSRNVMLLPAVGFDVVPTDCLALHLQQRLPTATSLTLAFQTRGPAGLPPGTANTGVELVPYGNRIRRGGRLIRPPRGLVRRQVDFGRGPVDTVRFTWGDVFTAYYTTGIPDIEVYVSAPPSLQQRMLLLDYIRPLFRLRPVRRFFRRRMRAGSTPEQRSQTRTSVWGEVRDPHGRTAVSRLHGPEAGVVWTAIATVAAARRVLDGAAQAGFRTPAGVFGADFVFEGTQDGEVVREDVE